MNLVFLHRVIKKKNNNNHYVSISKLYRFTLAMIDKTMVKKDEKQLLYLRNAIQEIRFPGIIEISMFIIHK